MTSTKCKNYPFIINIQYRPSGHLSDNWEQPSTPLHFTLGNVTFQVVQHLLNVQKEGSDGWQDD